MIDSLLGPTAVRAAGLVLILAVSFHVVLTLGQALWQARATRQLHQISLHLSETRLGAARQTRAFNLETSGLAWNGYRKFEIERITRDCKDICSFYLAPHDGKELPPFKPGQHLTFRLDIPGQHKPVVRLYSLSDGCSKHHYRVTIKKIGLVSGFFHEQLKEGDIVDVKAPRGSFFLDSSQARPVVLIGAGIGITPVYSMLKTSLDIGAGREIWFFLGVRNSMQHPLKEELEQLAESNENLQLHVCYSQPGEGDTYNVDYQHAERVSVRQLKRLLPSNNYEYFLCGPEGMMTELRDDLAQWGVPQTMIHQEAFGAVKVDTQKAVPPGTKIKFSRSGKEFPWEASSASLLKFAEQHGIGMKSGCLRGSCHECQTTILSGSVSYAIDPEEPPEAGSCLTCIATPQGALTLDA